MFCNFRSNTHLFPIIPGTIKLADFGASRKLHDLSLPDGGEGGQSATGSGAPLTGGDKRSPAASYQLRGTPYFMAPEVITGQRQGFEADVWSMGGTVLNMATGQPPWKHVGADNAASLLLHIATSNESPRIPESDNLAEGGVDPDLRSFLRNCFRRDPFARPSIAELLEHPFLCPAAANPSPNNRLSMGGACTGTVNSLFKVVYSLLGLRIIAF